MKGQRRGKALSDRVDGFGIPDDDLQKMFYHVTSGKWDGEDLVPSGDEGAFSFRWPEAGELGQYHAHVIHMFDNKKDAEDFHASFSSEDGEILEIDPNEFDWEMDDLEFPHPVAKRVPTSAISRILKRNSSAGKR